MSSAPTPPNAVITATDHGAIITITTACGMTFALLSMLIRVFSRATINGPWSHDDTSLAVAMVSDFQIFCCFQQLNLHLDFVRGPIGCKTRVSVSWAWKIHKVDLPDRTCRC